VLALEGDDRAPDLSARAGIALAQHTPEQATCLGPGQRRRL